MVEAIIDKVVNFLVKAEEDEREAEAMEFRRIVTTRENSYKLELKWMFNKQKEEVLEKVNNMLKDMTDLIMFDQNIWNINLYEMSYKHMLKAYQQNGQRVFNDLMLMGKKYKDILGNTTFDMEYPEALEYIDENALKLAGTVNQTTEEAIRVQLTTGFNEGLKIDEITANIARVFTTASRVRSVQIARTEMSRAANYGATSAYKQSNVVEAKEWLTAKDEKVCPFCGQMDVSQVDLESNFLNQFEAFEGRDGSTMVNNYSNVVAPPLHVVCRCTILPVMKDLTIEKPAKVDQSIIPLTSRQKRVIKLSDDLKFDQETIDELKIEAQLERDIELTDDQLKKLSRNFDKSTDFYINVPIVDKNKQFEALYKEGEFKNQFSLGKEATSKGVYGPFKGSKRDIWEKNFSSGILHENPEYKKLKKGDELNIKGIAKERPIYGYVSDPSSSSGSRINGTYGGVSFKLKKGVKNRSTIFYSNTSSFSPKKDYLQSSKNNSALIQNIIGNKNVSNEELMSMINGKKQVFGFVSKFENYAEAQIFGGINIKRDVDTIYVFKHHAHVKELADKFGVKYKVVKKGQLSAQLKNLIERVN